MNHERRIDFLSQTSRRSDDFFSTAPLVSCRVCFRDNRGVEHAVPVTAISRYQAFALALDKLRQCSWSNPDYSAVKSLDVHILDGKQKGRRLQVSRDEFEKWLVAEPQDRLKVWVQMLLGRIPPDRDFKRGLAVR